MNARLGVLYVAFRAAVWAVPRRRTACSGLRYGACRGLPRCGRLAVAEPCGPHAGGGICRRGAAAGCGVTL